MSATSTAPTATLWTDVFTFINGKIEVSPDMTQVGSPPPASLERRLLGALAARARHASQ